MPVSILTPTQRRQYGRFAETPSAEQIAKYCFLSPQEIANVVARRPQPWQQMGFAIQLMTVRFLGTFLDRRDVINVPQILVAFAAQQLHLRDIPNLSPYKKSIDVIRSHRDSIRERFGYSNFVDATTDYAHWLKARVLRAGDTLLELFDLSTAWCIERKVLLPAATTLERTMAPKRATFASIHDATLHGLWVELAKIAQGEKRADRLLALLNVSPDTGRTQIIVPISAAQKLAYRRHVIFG